MKTYEITEPVGSEITLKRGDVTLVVKVGEDKLIPDFVASVKSSVEKEPYQFLVALENAWHHVPNSSAKLEEILGWYRDKAFNSVKAEPVNEEPTISTESKPVSKTAKRKNKS